MVRLYIHLKYVKYVWCPEIAGDEVTMQNTGVCWDYGYDLLNRLVSVRKWPQDTQRMTAMTL